MPRALRQGQRQMVYFIKPIGMDGPIKIGCSVSPDNRRETLAQWSPFPLEVVAQIEGDFGLERRFHCKFNGSSRGREWFDNTPELTWAIASIQVGAFDLDSLPSGGSLTNFRRQRDLSFITPAHRYRRSASSRIRHLKWQSDLDWREVAASTAIPSDRSEDAEWLARKPEIEAQIAAWKAKYPLRPAPESAAA